MKVALAGLFISGWNRRRDEVRWRGKRGRLAYERWRHSGEVAKEYVIKDVELRDPTTLILIDEADRLRMASLEQVRAVFDAREIEVILIGMPGSKNAWHATPSSTRASDSFMSFGH